LGYVLTVDGADHDNAIKVWCAPAEEGAHNTLIALLRRNLFLPNCLRQMEIIRTELAAVSKPTIEAA
jgi:hypothetical protein